MKPIIRRIAKIIGIFACVIFGICAVMLIVAGLTGNLKVSTNVTGLPGASTSQSSQVTGDQTTGGQTTGGISGSLFGNSNGGNSGAQTGGQTAEGNGTTGGTTGGQTTDGNGTTGGQTTGGQTAGGTTGGLSSESSSPAAQQSSGGQVVLYEGSGIKITAIGMTEEASNISLNLTFENSSSQNLTFSSTRTEVNGFTVDAILLAEVPAGTSVTDTLQLNKSDLEHCGITAIAEISALLEVYDSATYNPYISELPIGLTTSATGATSDGRTFEGTELFNNGGIRIVAFEAERDSEYNTANIYLYIENTSDNSYSLDTDMIKVNGIDTTALYIDTIYPQSKRVGMVNIDSYDLEGTGISSIDYVNIDLEIENMNSWEVVGHTNSIDLYLQ